MPKTADLLEEIAVLKAMLIAADARDKRKDERIARLEKLVAAFKQAVFGRKSEKSDPDQFELALEDLETAMAVIHAEEDAEDRAAKRPAKPPRAGPVDCLSRQSVDGAGGGQPLVGGTLWGRAGTDAGRFRATG